MFTNWSDKALKLLMSVYELLAGFNIKEPAIQGENGFQAYSHNR